MQQRNDRRQQLPLHARRHAVVITTNAPRAQRTDRLTKFCCAFLSVGPLRRLKLLL